MHAPAPTAHQGPMNHPENRMGTAAMERVASSLTTSRKNDWTAKYTTPMATRTTKGLSRVLTSLNRKFIVRSFVMGKTAEVFECRAPYCYIIHMAQPAFQRSCA